MKDSRTTYSYRAGFAALLGLAALTHAQYGPPTINFCPTGVNTNLTCSPCTYNMTCNLNGGGLTIVGNGIKLNGNGYSIGSSPGDAITITGAGATITNISIGRPKGNGIRIVRTTTNLSTEYLNNVVIAWPGLNGVSREGAPYSSVYMKNTFIDMAYYGIYSPDEQRGARYIDVFDSYSDGNVGGFYSVNAATQHHARNNYRYNSNWGAGDVGHNNTNAGYYTNNNFDGNRNYGIVVSNNGTKTITLSGNSGTGNAFDCWADPGTALIATGNTWRTNHGCVSTR